VLLNLSAEKKRGSLLLAGAEKILREAAALREQVARADRDAAMNLYTMVQASHGSRVRGRGSFAAERA